MQSFIFIFPSAFIGSGFRYSVLSLPLQLFPSTNHRVHLLHSPGPSPIPKPSHQALACPWNVRNRFWPRLQLEEAPCPFNSLAEAQEQGTTGRYGCILLPSTC
ncbi:hypothetical protein E2C01_077311 [Portunus trituberculatus]|uniref:Uncharacterized protein n=1 Tax=Portunus trituberculatus TaxID=210409 RepID=A0A5B7ILX9_PORTR|nr:hypothetical protein [Portunus trituberculatus]